VLHKQDPEERVFVTTKLWRSHASFELADVERRLREHLRCGTCMPVNLLIKEGRKQSSETNTALSLVGTALSKCGVLIEREDQRVFGQMHWPGPGRDRDNGVLPSELLVIFFSSFLHSWVLPENWEPRMRVETFRHMHALCQSTGLVDAVGVSNFTIQQLQQLVDCGLKPGLAVCSSLVLLTPTSIAVNQIECHPMYTQRALREYCAREGIVVC
jgi:diketogulonate reductase-like aldo/keto reductase